uniref:SCP domain-containing protein n=1 Tax=Panagrolaimus sp. ES5 TaxID=591445 RepID=A0AC34F1L0_9BILA
MDDAARSFVVEYANFKRSLVAKNLAPMSLWHEYCSNCNYAPSATNMKKLTYNCSIETVVQQYARGIFLPHPNVHISTFGYFGTTILSIREAMQVALDDMFVILNNITVSQQNGKHVAMVQNDTFGTMGYRAPFIFGDAVSIGCARGSYIRNQTTVICGVTPSHAYGSAVYDVGIRCMENSHCTKPGYGICDTSLGLCSANDESADDGFFSMNDEARSYALEYANMKRSKIAKNLAPTNLIHGYGYANAPSASNMKKLVYNCSIETVAQLYASTCLSSSTSSYPGVFFGSAGFVSGNLTLHKMIELALDSFFSIESNITVSQQNGVSVAMVQNDEYGLMKYVSPFIYGDAVSIGCAKGKCTGNPNNPAVFCGITPVHTYGSALYDVGNPCTQNSHCTKPGYNICDISLGLCHP